MKNLFLCAWIACLSILCGGCASAEAQCAGGRCYSYGAYTPWAGFWYYQSPCAGGRCASKPKAEVTETAKGGEVTDHFREAAKMVAVEPAEPEPEVAKFKPFCQRVVELINNQRSSLGLPPLTLDHSLCSGCDSHSRYMQSYGFGHAYGIGGRECIAYGVRSPEAVVNLWLNSSGHRAIILGTGRFVGVGCSGSYWTLRVR